MCMTVTALSNQVSFFPSRMIHLSRKNLSRFCQRQKLNNINDNILERYLKLSYNISVFGTARNFCSNHRGLSTPKTYNESSTEFQTSTLTKEQAKELAIKLTSQERDNLLAALQECKSQEDKAGFEGQLAAFRWRSKFGRPSKVPTLGDVDPTGTYCTVPDDWLLRKYVEHVPEPATKELILVAIANAIPFIGFGFLDNFIMIVAGDQIEMILNRKFPISTMTAAALGNTVSDIIGIGSVHYVEMFAQKVGFEQPKLSPIQMNLPKTRVAANVGRAIGVTIGCLIGMTPIPIFALFHDN